MKYLRRQMTVNVRASGVGTALLVLVPKEENSEVSIR